MTTIFTRIIRGEIPGTFVHRDDLCVAFMTINPISDGHLLVVPVSEVDQWTDLPADLAAHLFAVSHRIAGAVKTAFECERVGLIIAGFEVDHCHIHVIPARSMADLNFANAATSVPRETLESNANRIRAALD
ncbi:MAG: HIT family protein [Actinobacteria bacterium]|nr:HIT family protein [Actinomycetota bacterium]